MTTDHFPEDARPVHVLLDVDGVINAVRWRQRPEDGWERHAKYKHVFGHYQGVPLSGSVSEAFTIRFSPDLVEALNALARRPGVSVFWLTTWLDEARYGLAPRIGLDGSDWPVLGKEQHRMATEQRWMQWWKLPAAQAHADAHPDARIVWIDDDLIDSDAIDWIASVAPRVLPVRPSTSVGLTPEHITEINEWITELQRTRDAVNRGERDA